MIGDIAHARRLRRDKVLVIALFVVLVGLRAAFAQEIGEYFDTPARSALFGLACLLVGLAVGGRRRRWWPTNEFPEPQPGEVRTHDVGLQTAHRGDRRNVDLTFERTGLAVCSRFSFHDELVPFASIASIHERPAAIELRFADATALLYPASFQARKDLLFSLALHCNAALERGIHLDAAETEQRERDAAAKARTSPAEDLSISRSGVPGLGSALAGPMDRGNVSPPRRSGLGAGLFPGAGSDDHTA